MWALETRTLFAHGKWVILISNLSTQSFSINHYRFTVCQMECIKSVQNILPAVTFMVVDSDAHSKHTD